MPVLRKALTAFGAHMSVEEELRWLWLACLTAVHVWDDDGWERMSALYLALTRQVGKRSASARRRLACALTGCCSPAS